MTMISTDRRSIGRTRRRSWATETDVAIFIPPRPLALAAGIHSMHRARPPGGSNGAVNRLRTAVQCL